MKKLLGLMAILVLFGGILVACEGSSNSELVGVWEHIGEEGTITYTFNNDGTGVDFIVFTAGDEIDFDFEWSVTDVNLTIVYDSEALGGITEWSYIIDDNTLILTRGDGYEVIFERVE